jgi:hypothetical protein
VRPLSLRVRLAALIGLLLVISGAALLAISYGLVSSNLNTPLPAGVPRSSGAPPANPQSHAAEPTPGP